MVNNLSLMQHSPEEACLYKNKAQFAQLENNWSTFKISRNEVIDLLRISKKQYYDGIAEKLKSKSLVASRKHVRAIYTHLNPTFIQKKLGFAGVYLFFLFLHQYIDCGYSLEPPRRGGSNMYPQSMF